MPIGHWCRFFVEKWFGRTLLVYFLDSNSVASLEERRCVRACVCTVCLCACVPVCAPCACVCTAPPVLPWTAAVVGDRRRRQRVREARPEKFLCFFVLRKLEEFRLLDHIPRKGGEPSDVQVLHDKLTPSLWQGGQTQRWVKVIWWRPR